MVQHDKTVAQATWHYEILNDFIIQQFPAIVSWLLSFLYTLRQRNADVYADKGGQLSHDLRYVSAVVRVALPTVGALPMSVRFSDATCASAYRYRLAISDCDLTRWSGCDGHACMCAWAWMCVGEMLHRCRTRSSRLENCCSSRSGCSSCRDMHSGCWILMSPLSRCRSTSGRTATPT